MTQLFNKDTASAHQSPVRLHRSILLDLLVIVLIILFVNFIYQHLSGGLSVQSRTNLKFAENPSLQSAWEQYPNVRPPLYSIILWMFSQSGFPVKFVNLIVFYATLVCLYFFAKHAISNVHYYYPILLYAVAHFNYINMYQYVSETFSAFLSLLSLSLLARYLKSSSMISLLLLAIVTSANCLMRLFSLFWIVPIVVYGIYLWAHCDIRRRIYHIAVFLSIVLAPVGIWFWKVYQISGYLTGMDRFGSRDLPETVSHWHNLTGLKTNIVFLCKTLFIDFFSLHRHASHAVIDHDWSISFAESAILVLLIVLTVITATVVIRTYRNRRANFVGKDGFWSNFLSSEAGLTLQFFAVYNLMIIILWTVGNNDPLYTRFMHPSYIFFILSVFVVYSWIKQANPSWLRIPFQVFYIALIVIQCFRSLSF